MKTKIELLTKTDYDGTWFIVRATFPDRGVKDSYSRSEDDARKKMAEIMRNIKNSHSEKVIETVEID